MDSQLQDDKTKIIITKLEEVNKQFHIMACEIDEQLSKIDSKMEAFSKYYIQTKEEIFKVLNINQYPESPKENPLERPSSSKILGKEKEEIKKLSLLETPLKID